MRDTFTLSSNIDSNKVFIVNRSEIDGRLDPLMALYDRKIRSFKYDITPLKNLLLRQPQYGANESGIERLDNKSIRYIRITDINEYGLLKTDSLGATAANIEEKYILSDGDILFARSGATVGKAYLHSRKNVAAECVFAGYMIRFIVDKSRLLPEYLFAYTQLSPYKEWVNAIQRAAGQPNINAEEYKSLQLPLPSLTEQYNIVKIIQQAYCQKQQKEAEAKALLDGIDDYLLSELGIKLPVKDNSLENRIFTISSKKIWGKRFDASYSMFDFRLNSSLYDIVPFAKYIQINPRWEKKTILKIQNEIIANCSFIPMDAINEKDGSVSKFADKNAQESNGYTPFIEGDILWAKITPCMQNGKSAITKQLVNRIGFGSTEFHVFRVNSNMFNNEYVLAILRLKVLLKNAMLYFGGAAGQQRVSADFFYELEIPIPPIEKQEEIATRISDIKAKAKALQQEAQNILDTAKKKVEQTILGE